VTYVKFCSLRWTLMVTCAHLNLIRVICRNGLHVWRRFWIRTCHISTLFHAYTLTHILSLSILVWHSSVPLPNFMHAQCRNEKDLSYKGAAASGPQSSWHRLMFLSSVSSLSSFPMLAENFLEIFTTSNYFWTGRGIYLEQTNFKLYFWKVTSNSKLQNQLRNYPHEPRWVPYEHQGLQSFEVCHSKLILNYFEVSLFVVNHPPPFLNEKKKKHKRAQVKFFYRSLLGVVRSHFSM